MVAIPSTCSARATLGEWEYMDRFYVSHRRWTNAGDDCSCPDFFKLGSRWMLLHFCHQVPSGSRYYLGRYEDRRFYPESFELINWPGGNLHAPRTMLDDKGRRILFANLNEGRTPDACEAAGWKGIMSLPVVIALTPDDTGICYDRRTASLAPRSAPIRRYSGRG